MERKFLVVRFGGIPRKLNSHGNREESNEETLAAFLQEIEKRTQKQKTGGKREKGTPWEHFR